MRVGKKKCSWNHIIQPDGEFTPLPPLSSLPTEVCTVVSDADCHVPVMTICNAVSPSSDCQLILRHFFNDSGVFCVNVSMTNDVSLAFTNARVNINIGEFIYLRLKHKAWCSKMIAVLLIHLTCLYFCAKFSRFQVDICRCRCPVVGHPDCHISNRCCGFCI